MHVHTGNFFATFAVPFEFFAVKSSDSNAPLQTLRPLLGCLDEGVRAYARAITSISTSTSLGKRDTSTVERAGGVMLKNRP